MALLLRGVRGYCIFVIVIIVHDGFSPLSIAMPDLTDVCTIVLLRLAELSLTGAYMIMQCV